MKAGRDISVRGLIATVVGNVINFGDTGVIVDILVTGSLVVVLFWNVGAILFMFWKYARDPPCLVLNPICCSSTVMMFGLTTSVPRKKWWNVALSLLVEVTAIVGGLQVWRKWMD